MENPNVRQEEKAILEMIKKLEEQWIEKDKSTREAKVKEFPNPALTGKSEKISGMLQMLLGKI